MVVRLRTMRRLVRMSPRRGRGAQKCVKNQELEELRRRIEELENKRNGNDEVYSEAEEDIEEEQNVVEVDPKYKFHVEMAS